MDKSRPPHRIEISKRQVGFKYCALHYLNLWLSKDRGFCEGLRKGKDDLEKLRTIRDAANFYRIARTFRTKNHDADPERYRPLLDIIESMSRGEF